MFNRVLIPTLIMAAMWLTVSLSTTTYLFWLDLSYQADFQQHVSCLEAASSLQSQLWRLQVDLERETDHSGMRASQIRTSTTEMQQELARIIAITGTSEHQQLVHELTTAAPKYWHDLETLASPDDSQPSMDQVRGVTEHLADIAGQLNELHHDQMHRAAESRDLISSMVMWFRGCAMFFGPLLGWWMARRLDRAVNEIRVTLENSAELDGGEPGATPLRSGDDLTLIKKQVKAFGERLRTSTEELERARHEVFRSDRLAATGRLAVGVAHELRNPLTSVKLLIQFAVAPENPPLSPRQFELILEEIERMETTIQGLLDLSRTAPMQRTRQDLRETLSRAAQLVAGRAVRQHVVTELDAGSEPLIVDGDHQQLHQVCVNLYLNAIESMPDGGRMTVLARSSPELSTVQIEVRDTGQGIRDDILPQLFEPFVTSKDRGTGLGLAISQRIIDAHDGIITAANVPEGGAAFTVELPLYHEEIRDSSHRQNGTALPRV